MPTELQKIIETGAVKPFEKFLIKSKHDPNWTDAMGLTALHYAGYFGKVDFIRKLLINGSDPNFKAAKYNATPLQWATYCGIKTAPKLNFRLNAEAIQALIDGGATYDIMSAVANEDLDQIKKILKAHPSEVNSKWMNGFSPLHVTKNFEIGKYLLKKKAKINQRSNDNTTPIIYLCGRLNADFNLVRLYLQNGAQVNDQNDSGNTALLGAIRRGHEAIVKILLEAGANKSLKNNKGESALDQAIKFKRLLA